MTAVDSNFVASSDLDEATASRSTAVNEVPEDETGCTEQQSVQVKLAELKASNHKLMVDNLALRARLEQVKSNRTFERRFFGFLGLSLWLLLVLAVALTAFILSNR